MTNELPAVSLPQYEGPLDLLLDLVRKHELNILDLPIAEVTRQYLDYLHRAREFDIDLGADFILMAATLIHIKSRSVLRPELDEGPDPRQELAEQLLTREQAQQAAVLLAQRLGTATETWSPPVPVAELNPVREADAGPESATPDRGRRTTMNLLDVLRVTKQALATAKAHRLLHLKREPVTIEELMRWLRQTVQQLGGHQALASAELFAAQSTAEGRVALFMAMLELARIQDVQLYQEQPLAPIHVSAGRRLAI